MTVLDAEQRKSQGEAAVLSRFLQALDLGLAYAPRTEADPHNDGFVLKDGERVAELKLTRYVVDDAGRGRRGSSQLAAVGAWNRGVWQRIDSVRRKVPELRSVMGTVEFAEPPRKDESDDLADQIIGVSAKAWTERSAQPLLPRLAAEPVTNLFIEVRSGCASNFQEFDAAYINPDATLFPLVSRYVRQIHLVESRDDWPEWWGPDMAVGGTAYCSDSLKHILETKAGKLCRRDATGLPIWLVIMCDLFDDVRTMIFPRDEIGRKAVKTWFDSARSDAATGPFDQVWLVSQAVGGSVRLDTIK